MAREEKTINVIWAPGEEYRFRYRDKHARDGSYKIVYMGVFLERAPQGLKPGTEYCLKEITVNGEDKYPQNRDYYDLVVFEGEHQRQILTRNACAAECGDKLKSKGTIDHCASRCYVVEPAYESVDTLLRERHSFSTAEQLQIPLQYALGCRELSEARNCIGSRWVRAHRDLKWSNGVADRSGGGWRIRLVDYASIKLDLDTLPTAEEQRLSANPEGTIGIGMSMSNTAPENLTGSGLEVTEKTDVFALGMMLASLFFVSGGQYQTPCSIWIRDHGWNGSKQACDHVKLLAAYRGCQKSYDSDATWDNTWIEQSLSAGNKEFQWAPVQPGQTMKMIRHLFFCATRIDPNQRPTLEQFISLLRQIIDHAKKHAARIPVSVYLIDQTELRRLGGLYARYAAQASAREIDAARRRGTAAPVALCIAYRRGLEIDSSPMQAVRLLSENPVSGSYELRSIVEACPMSNGTGPDMLVYALLKACTYLERHAQTHAFTGCVHIFTEEVPAMERMLPIRLKGEEDYDINAFCRLIQDRLEVERISIRAYTLRESAAYEEEDLWFTRFPIEAESVQTPPAVREKPPAPRQTPAPTPMADEDVFYAGPKASMEIWSDGSAVYVGLKEKYVKEAFKRWYSSASSPE